MIEHRWPLSIVADMSQFRVETKSLYSSSPFRPAVQATGPVVKYWMADVTFPIANDSKWPEMMAMMARLSGRSNILRIPDFARPLPFGVAAGKHKFSVPAGAPFSDSTYFSDGTGWDDKSSTGFLAANSEAGQDTVLISGLVANQTKSIEFSDLMEIDGYLYSSLVRASSNAAGQARVVIDPPLRTNVYSGSPVLFEYPTSPFQIAGEAENTSPGLGIGTSRNGVPIPYMKPASFKLIELIP